MSLLLNIVLEHVEKRFKGKIIFEDLNFQVDKGQTIGILGANGVGKSVLFKLICGLERPNQGRVFVNNVEVGREEDFPRDVGILINEPAFIPIYSGIKNLMLLAEINNTVDEKTVKSYMKSVGLDPENQTKVQNYSLGMKKKLAICQAIMENQSIILLDEPFNGLDFSSVLEVKKILGELIQEGKTILLTSHHQQDLDAICDELYIIDDYHLKILTDEIRNEYFQ